MPPVEGGQRLHVERIAQDRIVGRAGNDHALRLACRKARAQLADQPGEALAGKVEVVTRRSAGPEDEVPAVRVSSARGT